VQADLAGQPAAAVILLPLEQQLPAIDRAVAEYQLLVRETWPGLADDVVLLNANRFRVALLKRVRTLLAAMPALTEGRA
jgi:hypothetical protein